MSENMLPSCSICDIKETIIWRKSFKDGIICNQCFISKYLNKNGKSNTNILISQEGTDMDQNFQDSDNLNVRKSQRVKNKLQKKNNNCSDKGKGRRSLLFKKNMVTKSLTDRANIKTSNQLYYKGIYYQTGDIVALTDISEDIYYAQIKGFIKDAYLNTGVYIQWLLPKNVISNCDTFNPLDFNLGDEENTPRQLDTIEFVCRLPLDFFMHKNIPAYKESYISGDDQYIYTTIDNIAKNSRVTSNKLPTSNQIFIGN